MRRELRDLLPRGSLALRPKRSGSVVGLVGQVSGGERGAGGYKGWLGGLSSWVGRGGVRFW